MISLKNTPHPLRPMATPAAFRFPLDGAAPSV